MWWNRHQKEFWWICLTNSHLLRISNEGSDKERRIFIPIQKRFGHFEIHFHYWLDRRWKNISRTLSKSKKKIHKKKYLNFHAKIMILGWSKRPKHEPTTIFCDHGFGCTILKSSGTKTTKTIVLKKENHQYYHQNIQWRYIICRKL